MDITRKNSNTMQVKVSSVEWNHITQNAGFMDWWRGRDDRGTMRQLEKTKSKGWQQFVALWKRLLYLYKGDTDKAIQYFNTLRVQAQIKMDLHKIAAGLRVVPKRTPKPRAVVRPSKQYEQWFKQVQIIGNQIRTIVQDLRKHYDTREEWFVDLQKAITPSLGWEPVMEEEGKRKKPAAKPSSPKAAPAAPAEETIEKPYKTIEPETISPEQEQINKANFVYRLVENNQPFPKEWQTDMYMKNLYNDLTQKGKKDDTGSKESNSVKNPRLQPMEVNKIVNDINNNIIKSIENIPQNLRDNPRIQEALKRKTAARNDKLLNIKLAKNLQKLMVGKLIV